MTGPQSPSPHCQGALEPGLRSRGGYRCESDVRGHCPVSNNDDLRHRATPEYGEEEVSRKDQPESLAVGEIRSLKSRWRKLKTCGAVEEMVVLGCEKELEADQERNREMGLADDSGGMPRTPMRNVDDDEATETEQLDDTLTPEPPEMVWSSRRKGKLKLLKWNDDGCCSPGKTCATHNSRLIKKQCGVGFQSRDIEHEVEVLENEKAHGEEEENAVEHDDRHMSLQILDSQAADSTDDHGCHQLTCEPAVCNGPGLNREGWHGTTYEPIGEGVPEGRMAGRTPESRTEDVARPKAALERDLAVDTPGTSVGSADVKIGKSIGAWKTGVGEAMLIHGGVGMSALMMLLKKDPRSPCCSVTEGDERGWVEIEVTIDSGACDTVMPTSLCPHISIISTEDSRRGLEYEVANGETIPNVGERHCILMTEDSLQPKKITFQCADIHKPLLSVSRCADLGYQCVLEKDGGQLVDKATGEVIPLHRRGNLYVMRAWVRQDKSSDFGRPQ